MAKKYLSIEEAAERIGISPDELKKLRERGDIRAFADRGTWKFREDDVDELGRKRQTDSDPEVPIQRTPSASKKKDDLANTILFEDDTSDDGSSIDLGAEHESSVGEQPTIVRKSADDLLGSDSDVRLVFDDSLLPDEETDLNPVDDLTQSDSDVRLISSGSDDGSDSDVKLVPDPSSVKSGGGQGSDSDVTLVGSVHDSFTLDLDESDGSFILGGEASGIALASESQVHDSGITLEVPNDSGIALETDDSGISLEFGDSGITLDSGSGISLETDDSGLMLAGDSGISLLGPSDSGIALEGPSSGSKKKGKKGKVDLGGTMPEIPMMSVPDDDMGATQMEVPMLSGDDMDSEFEFTASPLDEDSSASVVMLGDADDTPPRKSGGKKGGRKQQDDDDLFDTATTTEFGSSDMLDSSAAFDSSEDYAAVDSSDDMEVADDVIGEDDEITEDVFGAGDDDFDEELTSGSSSAEFVTSPVGGGRMAMPVQAEWGGGTFFMLFLSSTVMLLTSFLMYDVVRTMWGNNDPTAGTEMILSSFRGMFG